MRGYVLRKKDANQDEIVARLRKLGVKVHIASCEYDLLCQYGGMTMLVEVRPEGKPKKAREGRQERFQETFMVRWASSLEDCQDIAQTLRKWQACVSERWAVQ